MKHILKVLLIVSSLALLSSCGVDGFGEHDQDYVKAGSVKPMVIPKGISSPVKNNYYLIPNYQIKSDTKPVSLLPPGNNVSSYH